VEALDVEINGFDLAYILLVSFFAITIQVTRNTRRLYGIKIVR